MRTFFSFCICIFLIFPLVQAETIDSLQSILSQSAKQRDIPQLISIHMELGEAFEGRYEHDLTLDHFQKALTLIQSESYTKKEFEVLNHIGTLYYWKDEPDEALNYLMRARKLGMDTASEKDKAKNLSQIAQVYLHLGNHKQALFHQFQARNLSEMGGDSLGMAQSYNSLGVIYFQNFRYTEGEKFLLQALNIYRELNYPLNLWSILATLSSAELDQGDLSAALSYCKEAKALAEKNDIRYGIAFSTGTLGLIHLEQQELDIAEHHLRQSLTLFRELGVQAETAEFSYGLADLMLQRDQYQQAIDTIEVVLATAQQIQSPRIAKEAYEKLSIIYAQMGNLELALKFLKEHLIYRDSIEKKILIQQSIGAEREFEIQQKLLEDSLALQLNKQAQNQAYTWLLIGSWILFACLGLYFFSRYRRLLSLHQRMSKEQVQLQEQSSHVTNNHAGLSDLIALTSQRIQQPLANIQSFLSDKNIESEDRFIQQELDQLESWFADISVYAALGHHKAHAEEIDLGILVGQAIEQLPSKLRLHATKIRVKDLPVLHGNPQSFKLLFRHLLLEAIVQSKETESDILIESKQLTGLVEIDISYQQHAMTEDGNDLGFNISKAILENQGGQIRKIHDPVTGSKITFTLPN